MQCVILAAGEGVRMRPLTLTTPKPMLKVLGKPILEHIIDSLPKEIDEVIIVIGYLGDQIKNHFGNSFGGRVIRYVSQKEKKGTFNALSLTEEFLKDEHFLLLYADDFHSPESIAHCVQKNSLCLLLSRVPNPERFGVVLLNPDNTIKEIEEKPKEPKSTLVSCGPVVLSKKVFKYPPPQNQNGEYYVPDSINLMVKDGYKFETTECSWWVPIGYPEDLEKAEAFLKEIQQK